jgi:hypothetical protein
MTIIEAQMVRALAEIDAALGLPEDGCNSTHRTLLAIRLLHEAHKDDVAEIERLLRCQREAGHAERRATEVYYRGFAYNVRAQFGVDSLKAALRRDGND